MIVRSITSVLTCLIILIPTSAQIAYRGLPEWSWQHEDSTEYYLYTPANLEPKKKYPVALFLHGCCGNSYRATLRNTVDPPARMWHQFGKNKQIIPTYIIAPATSRGWSQHFANLKVVIEDLIRNGQADPQRIYVCGFSMGGEGTYQILQAYPGFFAAAITMGMTLRGDSTRVQYTPIWANRGQTDWFARDLPEKVAAIRHLNGYAEDTGTTWVTGVNPRFSSFEGVDHGVQWKAASTQDLTAWAYSKVNDGNQYPIVYFTSPNYGTRVAKGASIHLTLQAKDPDGKIDHIDLSVNGKKTGRLISSPYRQIIQIGEGDYKIEATAYDEKGKSSTATLLLQSNIRPSISTAKIPAATAGRIYQIKLRGSGNGTLHFMASKNSALPDGLRLYPDGALKGYFAYPGKYAFTVVLSDQDGEMVNKEFALTVNPKAAGAVLISEVITTSGNSCPVTTVQPGESPYFNGKDSGLTTETEEINFSQTGHFEGLPLIQTDPTDANEQGDSYLQFKLDEDATVYIAYETLLPDSATTIPGWLKEFSDTGEEIIAQYRYFRVYQKEFLKGGVSIPGADARSNHVAGNYFVMVRTKR